MGVFVRYLQPPGTPEVILALEMEKNGFLEYPILLDRDRSIKFLGQMLVRGADPGPTTATTAARARPRGWHFSTHTTQNPVSAAACLLATRCVRRFP